MLALAGTRASECVHSMQLILLFESACGASHPSIIHSGIAQQQRIPCAIINRRLISRDADAAAKKRNLRSIITKY